MPKLPATTFRSSIRQSRGLRRILAMSFAAFDTGIWYHMRYHKAMAYTALSVPFTRKESPCHRGRSRVSLCFWEREGEVHRLSSRLSRHRKGVTFACWRQSRCRREPLFIGGSCIAVPSLWVDSTLEGRVLDGHAEGHLEARDWA